MKKAVFFDIDGTLLDGSRGMFAMTETTRRAIRQLQKNGDFVFLASGRPYAFIYQDLLDFGFDGFILMNGACIKIGEKVIYRQTLPVDFVRSVCAVCHEHQIEYLLEGEDEVYLDANFQRLSDFYESFQMPQTRLRREFPFDQIVQRTFKMEFGLKSEEQLAICHAFVGEDIDYMRDPRLKRHFELYSKKATKATAILKTLEYLGIALENSYAFGDGKNDMEMLGTVKHSFAMGNAAAEVQAIAAHVVPAVQHDGVASGIAQYILA
ncbi:MAG: Cof-type HAD-IIB family hydrolase [Selenomonadaceae bacterium]